MGRLSLVLGTLGVRGIWGGSEMQWWDEEQRARGLRLARRTPGLGLRWGPRAAATCGAAARTPSVEAAPGGRGFESCPRLRAPPPSRPGFEASPHRRRRRRPLPVARCPLPCPGKRTRRRRRLTHRSPPRRAGGGRGEGGGAAQHFLPSPLPPSLQPQWYRPAPLSPARRGPAARTTARRGGALKGAAPHPLSPPVPTFPRPCCYP